MADNLLRTVFRWRETSLKRVEVPSALFLLLIVNSFLLSITMLPTFAAPALPGPPIFEAIAHYPSFCYLPPESGLCQPMNRTRDTITMGTQESVATNNLALSSTEEGSDEGEQQRVLLTRYYFDTVTAQCYPFGAQNCGGNENRFKTHAECLGKCRIEVLSQ